MGDMPPDDAPAKPSDEERKVLQAWLSAGAPAWESPAPDNSKSAANPKEAIESQLWVEVHEIFEHKCMKCHDGPNPQSGVNGLQIVNYESLTK
ncbi:hypothetical protein, partial [Enterococcus casseliflavus]|uniref:hypothetical protein n=1 Tax=Enterococcus casseliflavus TaxID=37734 RepID=UPI003D0E9A6C